MPTHNNEIRQSLATVPLEHSAFGLYYKWPSGLGWRLGGCHLEIIINSITPASTADYYSIAAALYCVFKLS